MKHVDRLAFDAALLDLWRDEGADPEQIFARQGLAIVPLARGKDDVKLVNRFVDDLTHDSGLVVEVKERINGPIFDAVDVEDIRRFADDFFDE